MFNALSKKLFYQYHSQKYLHFLCHFKFCRIIMDPFFNFDSGGIKTLDEKVTLKILNIYLTFYCNKFKREYNYEISHNNFCWLLFHGNW